jgi:hypothetical protein
VRLQPGVEVGKGAEIEQGFTELFEAVGRQARDLRFHGRIKKEKTAIGYTGKSYFSWKRAK